MSEVDLDEWCARLAEEVRAETAAGRSKKWRCPEELRARIVAYAEICRERGDPVFDIASRLGLVESTVARWLRRARARAREGFRSVAIVAADQIGDCSHNGYPHPSTLRLISPRGYCVEGLDPETLAWVLRAVG